MVDTNGDPSQINYPIPANDDATKAITLILDYVQAAIEAGQKKAAAASKPADKTEKAPEKPESAEKPAAEAEEPEKKAEKGEE